jgi:hypothetical protein
VLETDSRSTDAHVDGDDDEHGFDEEDLPGTAQDATDFLGEAGVFNLEGSFMSCITRRGPQVPRLLDKNNWPVCFWDTEDDQDPTKARLGSRKYDTGDLKQYILTKIARIQNSHCQRMPARAM